MMKWYIFGNVITGTTRRILAVSVNAAVHLLAMFRIIDEPDTWLLIYEEDND